METLKKKHSIIGIASFIIALVTVTFFFAITIYDVNALLEDGVYYGTSFGNVAFAIQAILNPIGTGFGISSLFQKGTKKTLSIIGLVINLPFTLFAFFAILSSY